MNNETVITQPEMDEKTKYVSEIQALQERVRHLARQLASHRQGVEEMLMEIWDYEGEDDGIAEIAERHGWGDIFTKQMSVEAEVIFTVPVSVDIDQREVQDWIEECMDRNPPCFLEDYPGSSWEFGQALISNV